MPYDFLFGRLKPKTVKKFSILAPNILPLPVLYYPKEAIKRC